MEMAAFIKINCPSDASCRVKLVKSNKLLQKISTKSYLNKSYSLIGYKLFLRP